MSPFEIASIVMTAGAMVAAAGNAVISLKVHSEIAEFKLWALRTFVARRNVALENPRDKKRSKVHVG